MKTKLFSILVVSGFLGTLAACGSPSVSDSLDDAISTQCAKAFDCMSSFPTDEGFAFEDLYGSSESACVSNLETASAESKSQYQASVDAGRIIYNADDAQACLDAENALSCDQFWRGDSPEPTACDTAFQGTVADGGACTIDDDCATGSSECDPSTMTCTPEG
jgi:hypothetical protein